jgi:hypothetical protein
VKKTAAQSGSLNAVLLHKCTCMASEQLRGYASPYRNWAGLLSVTASP